MRQPSMWKSRMAMYMNRGVLEFRLPVTPAMVAGRGRGNAQLM